MVGSSDRVMTMRVRWLCFLLNRSQMPLSSFCVTMSLADSLYSKLLKLPDYNGYGVPESRPSFLTFNFLDSKS